MTAKHYDPQPLADATAENDGERWTLVFTRELHHAPERVWEALTDPAALREWSPFDADRNLATNHEATLVMAGGGAGDASESFASTIRIADAPRVLEYTWGNDVLRWELERQSYGTRLTLRHKVEDASWLARVAAGWHICLDVADAYLSGNRIGRIVGADAKPWWEGLNAAYAKKLGMKDEGWPEEGPLSDER
ncbi:MAG: SRPBCC family protein [Thermoanaerobaculia bacterium]